MSSRFSNRFIRIRGTLCVWRSMVAQWRMRPTERRDLRAARFPRRVDGSLVDGWRAPICRSLFLLSGCLFLFFFVVLYFFCLLFFCMQPLVING